jgi:predicted DNA-binding protein with PD1-like motif
MKSLKQDRGFLLRLDRGEDVKSAIEEFVRREGIQGGFVVGLGAVKNPELGYFSPGDKSYSRRVLEGFWEVGSLVGNISVLGGKPFAHLHATVSDATLQARTGHLFAGEVSVTMELFIVPGEEKWPRVPDPASGFNPLLG